MNFVVVLYIIGWILEFEAVFLLLPVFVAAYYGEVPQVLSFCIAASVSYILGFLLKLRKPSSKELYMREGFVTVAFGWISLSLIGAIPFTLSGDIPRYIDAVFESISGFTTTGASILTDVEALSKSGLFWRSFTHWIGGMGVFVFIMSILPLMGSSTMNLMKAESTGPSVDKFVPKTRDTAKLLYEIYLGLTVIGCIVFMICGLPFYDAVTTIFGTVGTGGFGIFNTSIGGYNPAVQWAVTIFMLLAGLNYTFYFCLISKKIKEAFDIEEIKWYIALVVVCVIMITV
nr:TrkH family potassium uptake protein [Lachnospiraceae bacterium]